MTADIQVLAHIQEKIKQGKNDTAVKMLLETIFMNPHLFDYDDFDEDSKADFLLSLHGIIPKIIASYSEKRAQFTPYIITVIRLYSKNWRRRIVQNRAKIDSINYCYKMEFDSAETALDNPDTTAQENHYFSPVSFVEEPAETKTHGNNDLAKTLKTVDVTMFEKRAQKHVRELILILTLKSAFYISEKQAAAVAHELGIDPERLQAMLETVRRSMEKKSKLMRRAIESRNTSYFLKNRYEFELEKLEKTSGRYTDLRRRLDFQKQKLKQQNLILKNRHKDTLTASNELVGQIINMRARKICYLLSLLKLRD